jgi:hypothetical protein
MEINAKLIQLLPMQTGEGKNGKWKKQDIIVETDGQYPKKLCVSVWGDKIDEKQLVAGKMLNISFDIESREYNGRWYTDVKAWKIESSDPTVQSPGKTTEPTIDISEFDEKEDLPF